MSISFFGEQRHLYFWWGAFPEKRFFDWNFVSSGNVLIEESRQKSKEQVFPKIVGEETWYMLNPSFDKNQKSQRALTDYSINNIATLIPKKYPIQVYFEP